MQLRWKRWAMNRTAIQKSGTAGFMRSLPSQTGSTAPDVEKLLTIPRQTTPERAV